MVDIDKKIIRKDGTKINRPINGEPPRGPYSDWHKTLGPDYIAYDIDYVEYRSDRGIVAFICVTGRCEDENHINHSKKYIWHRAKIEIELLKELSKKFELPTFFVIHTEDLSLFHVYNLEDIPEEIIKGDKEKFKDFMKDVKYKRLNQGEYAIFIKKL